MAVITGGYGGTMEAASEGASENGGHVIGVVAPTLFPDRTGANDHVAEVIEAEDLLDRIDQMIRRAGGVIALPGSIGTAAELILAWNHNFLSRRNGYPVLPTVAVGESWRALSTTMLSEIAAEPGDIYLADDHAEALEWLLPRLP